MQGSGTPTHSVFRSATSVKIKVNSQLEIFSIVNNQATISLCYTQSRLSKILVINPQS